MYKEWCAQMCLFQHSLQSNRFGSCLEYDFLFDKAFNSHWLRWLVGCVVLLDHHESRFQCNNRSFQEMLSNVHFHLSILKDEHI